MYICPPEGWTVGFHYFPYFFSVRDYHTYPPPFRTHLLLCVFESPRPAGVFVVYLSVSMSMYSELDSASFLYNTLNQSQHFGIFQVHKILMRPESKFKRFNKQQATHVLIHCHCTVTYVL